MTLCMIGCQYENTPLEVRERLAFSTEETSKALAEWKHVFPAIEAVLLSTCNRTELYTAVRSQTKSDESNGLFPATERDDLPDQQFFLAFLRRIGKLDAAGCETVAPYLLRLADTEATRHLFEVTAALDSMVLGEVQILSQVKQAYHQAVEAETARQAMHALFQSALKSAKRVANETEIGRHRLSIPSVAVGDFVLRLFERLSDRSVLILGAGQMAEETVRYLQEQGTSELYVTNRSRAAAEKLARTWNGTVIHWENRFEQLEKVDLAVGTTGAPEPVLHDEEYACIAPRRKGPLFLLDLALPRDFDPKINERKDVYLYTLDDLKEVCEANRLARDREIPHAKRIIEEESRDFLRNTNHRRAGGPLMRLLRDEWEKSKEAELHRLLNRLEGLDAKSEKEIRRAFDRLLGKLLHPPQEQLRDEAKDGVPHTLLDALTRLFRLK